MPGTPHGRDGGDRQGFPASGGAPDDFWQWGRGEDKRNAMQQKGQDQIGKAVRVGQGNHAEVRPVGSQPHGGYEVVGIGGELGGGGGTKGRRGLAGFEGAKGQAFAPGGEDIEDEFRRVAPGQDKRVIGKRSGRAGSGEFAKGPAASRCDVPQGRVPVSFGGDTAPPFVKHC